MSFRHYFIFFITLLFVVACNTQTTNSTSPKKYGKHTKLFLDYKLGMGREEFYDHSWDLNDKGLVRQGPDNQSVYYKLDDELDHPAQMYFYPSFYNGRVYQMRIRFKYRNWAPWNKNLYADSLQVEVIKLFRKWYGNGFVQKEIKKNKPNKTLYVKQDSNRRITITTKDSQNVVAFITDIVAGKEAREARNQSRDNNP